LSRRASAWLLVGVLLVGCSDEAEEPVITTATAAVPTPHVEHIGCEEIEAEVCVLPPDPSSLIVWVDVPASTHVDVLIDGIASDHQRTEAEGGLRITVPLAAEPEMLELRGVDPPWTQSWSLPLVRRPEPPAMTRARALAVKSELAAASRELETALPSATPRERVLIIDFLRRLFWNLGDPTRALALAIEEAELARKQGLPRAEAEAASMAAFLLADVQQDFVAARRWIERLRVHAPALPEARINVSYQSGVISRRTGDITAALRELETALRTAERFGNPRVTEVALFLAVALGELGRGDEARKAASRSLEFARVLPCNAQARQLNTVGYVQLVLAEQGLDHDPPEELFEEALQRVAPDGACPEAALEADVHIGLAMAELERDEPEEALRQLETIEEMPPTLEPWAEEIRARAGLLTGRWELVPAIGMQPDPMLPLHLRWAAFERQAMVLERFGAFDAALTMHREAEDLLEDAVTSIGIDVGAELFLAGRSASARALVSALVDAGREDEAFCRARIARSRALRRLDRAARLDRASEEVRSGWDDAVLAYVSTRQRHASEAARDWELSATERTHVEARRAEETRAVTSRLDAALTVLGTRRGPTTCDDLTPLRADEQTLLVFPVDDAWLLLLADAKGVIATVRAEPGEHVLDGLADHIAAQRIRVLPTGESWRVPFHALPFRGGALVDVASVSYGLDLPDVEREAAGGHALVVSDPSADLPLARQEADAVEHRLRELGWPVDVRRGDAATRSAIADALAGARLLHYAGHGVHRGMAGWGAALVLPDGDELAVADVLALPAVPRNVVLSGCETGQTSAGTIDGGMSLGRAFALAGAQSVVITDARVDDAVARRVGEGLYADAELDLVAGLRRVQLELRRDGVEQWNAFRVLIR
jgi:tetratricopeptide (TPR) repeat protein